MKINKTIPFILLFSFKLRFFLIFSLLIINYLIWINISWSKSWLIKPGENEKKVIEIENFIIQSTINAKVRYINFSDSKEYDREREIVYMITNMQESEEYSEGSMKQAVIRIALEDLNDDGINEILSYIIQYEWCGKGGGYCTFIIFQKDRNEKWKAIFNLLTYPDIGISNTKNKGYYDIVFRNLTFLVIGDKVLRDWQDIVIWRWDGRVYKPYMKGEAKYNPETKKDKVIISNWDESISDWKEVKIFYL